MGASHLDFFSIVGDPHDGNGVEFERLASKIYFSKSWEVRISSCGKLRESRYRALGRQELTQQALTVPHGLLKCLRVEIVFSMFFLVSASFGWRFFSVKYAIAFCTVAQRLNGLCIFHCLTP